MAVNEKRLIDANALISNLRTFKGLGAFVAETLVRFTEKQPTVDAVEVVRCRNCKNWKYDARKLCGRCDKVIMYTPDYFWCMYGARKGNG